MLRIGCVIAVIAGLFILSSNVGAEPPRNSPWDSSVRQVERWLKAHLKDPDSYQSIEWSRVVARPGTPCPYTVRHKYRAKNSFGGYVIENKLFCLDSAGNVVASTDFGR